VPDLTHTPTTRLLYSLLESDTVMQPSHVDLLRQIRVFKDSEQVVLSKWGRTQMMGLGGEEEDEAVAGEDWTVLEGQKEGMTVEA